MGKTTLTRAFEDALYLSSDRKVPRQPDGRKTTVLLLPVLENEFEAFGVTDLNRRLLRGGLPEPLLAATPDPTNYAEWLDSYYARDVQELFPIRKRRAFITPRGREDGVTRSSASGTRTNSSRSLCGHSGLSTRMGGIIS